MDSALLERAHSQAAMTDIRLRNQGCGMKNLGAFISTEVDLSFLRGRPHILICPQRSLEGNTRRKGNGDDVETSEPEHRIVDLTVEVGSFGA